MARTRHKRKRRPSRKQKPSTAWLIVVVGVGLILVGVAMALLLPKPKEYTANTDEPSAVPVAVDYDAPTLTLTDLNGQPVSLQDYRGKVVLVNLWATWCPPCRAEMPTLEGYYRDHHNEGFVILAVEVGGDPHDQIVNFAERFDLTFPVLEDPQGASLVAFRIPPSLPSSFVIDPEGRVKLAWVGAISRTMLEKYVTPMLTR